MMSSRSTSTSLRSSNCSSERFGQEGLVDEGCVEQFRTAVGELESRGDRRQRASQFVRCVTDEPALRGLAGFEAIQQLIHRDGQAGDLIVGGRDRYPVGELAARHRRHPRPDALDGI
jgi:hypothetical protein